MRYAYGQPSALGYPSLRDEYSVLSGSGVAVVSEAMPNTSWLEGHPFEDIKGPPGRSYYRPTWGQESFFAAGRPQAPGYADILLSAQLGLPPSLVFNKETVRAAAKLLRWELPTVAARAVYPPSERGGLPNWLYICHSEDDLELWLDRIVFDQSLYPSESQGRLSTAVQKLRGRLGRADAPLSASYLFEIHFISNPTGHEGALVLRFSHALFDAAGSFSALDFLIRSLAVYDKDTPIPDKLDWGTEYVRLSPAVPDVAKSSPTPNAEDDEAMINRIIAAASLPPTSAGLRANTSTEPSLTTSHLLAIMPAPISAQLSKAARLNQVGLFATLVAANYMALLSLTDLKNADRTALHGSLVPVASNLRIRSLDISSQESRLMTNALGSLAIIARNLSRFFTLPADIDQVPSKQPFPTTTDKIWMLAREIQEQLDVQRVPQDAAYRWLPRAINGIITLRKTEPSVEWPVRQVNVISLGNVSTNLCSAYPISGHNELGHRITVADPILSFVTYAMAASGPGALLHVYGWGEGPSCELRLSASWCKDSIVEGGKGVSDYVKVMEGVLEQLASADGERSCHLGA